MATVLIIIFCSALAALGANYAIKHFSYSEEEERTPVENYDLINPMKTKTKKVTKSKTKK
jgi:hypothetical protein